MPGFYADGEYDIAGFIVGVVERSRVIDGRSIVPGDVLIGLPSAGLHTNGYSLARRVLFESTGWTADTVVPGARRHGRRRAAGAAPLVSAGGAAATRTSDAQGAGAYHRRRYHRESSARVARRVQCRDRSAARGTCRRCFSCCRSAGRFARDEMFRAFNMGIGLILVCAPAETEQIIDTLARNGEPHAVRIGLVVSGVSRRGLRREPPARRADLRPRIQSPVDD